MLPPAQRATQTIPRASHPETCSTDDCAALALPSSGQLVGAIIEALDLHAFDAKGVFSTPHARRHLRGDRGRSDTARRVLEALSVALVAGDLVPASLVVMRAATDEAPTPAVLSAGVYRLLAPAMDRWDEIGEQLGTLSVRGDAVRRARATVLRLVVIDLATRVAAARWLIDRDRARPLAESWDTLPTLPLAPGTSHADHASPKGESPVERRLRSALRVVRGKLAEAIGGTAADETVARFVTYTDALLALLQRPSTIAARREQRVRTTMANGTEHTNGTESLWLGAMLRSLWKAETDLHWRNSLRAANGSWPAHLAVALNGASPANARELGRPARATGVPRRP